jgi:hypothetical protein
MLRYHDAATCEPPPAAPALLCVPAPAATPAVEFPEVVDFACPRPGCGCGWADILHDDDDDGQVLACVMCLYRTRLKVVRKRTKPVAPGQRFPEGRYAGKTVAEAMADGEVGKTYVRFYATRGGSDVLRAECVAAVST